MSKKNVKVKNTASCRVTINLKDFNEKVIPVKPKGFVKLDEDELTYIMNTSQIFKKGTLKVVNKDELTESIDKEELKSSNLLSDKDIVDLLNRNQKTIKSRLNEIDNEHVIRRILNKAKELDKSVKVVEIIEERLEELIS